MKKKKEALDIIYPELDATKHYNHCYKCGRTFKEDDKDYITIEGNLYSGDNQGIITGNIPLIDGTEPDADKFSKKDIHKTKICMSCLIKEIEEQRQEVLNDLNLRLADLARQVNENRARLDRYSNKPSFITIIVNSCAALLGGCALYNILTSTKIDIFNYIILGISIILLLVETIKLIRTSLISKEDDDLAN